MPLEDISLVVSDTPYMSIRRAQAIQDFLKRHMKRPPKRFLEIGTFRGAGTCFLGEIARQNGGNLVTVDLEGNYERRKVGGLIVKCGLVNVVSVEFQEGAQGLFRYHFSQNNLPYDFIYHDAAHNWTDATAIFSMAYAALSERGIMAIDDIRHKDYPDLTLMWEKVIPSLANKVVDPGYNLGWVLK